MSDSKKHNSIIFLTTLSVYLGLVLVGGASSPVLAQAALTRNFDIQEEIEYKDDLDKKPDDEKSDKAFEKKQSLEHYFDILSQFVEKASLSDYRVSINVNCDFCRQNFGNEFSLKKKYFALENLEYDYGKDRVISKLNLQPETFDADSNELVSHLNEKLLSLRSVSKSAFKKLILDNTSVITENNQVFVVTRLPRASIDSLLAKPDAN
jgi:hypothetical protein